MRRRAGGTVELAADEASPSVLADARCLCRLGGALAQEAFIEKTKLKNTTLKNQHQKLQKSLTEKKEMGFASQKSTLQPTSLALPCGGQSDW